MVGVHPLCDAQDERRKTSNKSITTGKEFLILKDLLYKIFIIPLYLYLFKSLKLPVNQDLEFIHAKGLPITDLLKSLMAAGKWEFEFFKDLILDKRDCLRQN